MKALIDNWQNFQKINVQKNTHPWFYQRSCELPLANLFIQEALHSSCPSLLREKTVSKNLEVHYHPFFFETLNENHKKIYRFINLQHRKKNKILIYFFMDENQEKTDEALTILKTIVKSYSSSFSIACFFPVEANQTKKSFILFFQETKMILKNRNFHFLTNSEFMTMGEDFKNYLFFDLNFASRLYDAWIYHYVLGHGAYLPQLESTPSKDKYTLKKSYQLSPHHALELYEQR